ncbi:hypothetical protein TSAR_003764, partial [Trichomalopsis sarcophagae]
IHKLRLVSFRIVFFYDFNTLLLYCTTFYIRPFSTSFEPIRYLLCYEIIQES